MISERTVTMDRLLTVADIMERYKCSANTARGRMRQMAHMEKPLLVSERAVMDWEAGKTVYPVTRRKMLKKGWAV